MGLDLEGGVGAHLLLRYRQLLRHLVGVGVGVRVRARARVRVRVWGEG